MSQETIENVDISMLPEYLQRIFVEQRELTVKSKALQDFIKNSPIFQVMNPEQKSLQLLQLSVMTTYGQILVERIRVEVALL